MQPVVEVVSKWLLQLNFPLSKKYFKKLLLTHPNFPSLLSVTDSLDALRIEHVALKIEHNELNEIPTPFLAHMGGSKDEFVIVRNFNRLSGQIPDFFDRWTGVVLVAEVQREWSHATNSLHRKEKLLQNGYVWFIVTSLCLLTLFQVVKQPSWIIFILLSISMTGIAACSLIVAKELRLTSKFGDRVCGKSTTCSVLILSKGSKIAGLLSWSDVGIIWFAFQLLMLLIGSMAGIQNRLLPAISIMATASLPFTIFFIYYQWRIVKKWCKLCLIVTALIWIEFFLVFPVVMNFTTGYLWINSFLLMALLLLVVSTSWLAVKKLLFQNRKLEERGIVLEKFLRNGDILETLLQKEQETDRQSFPHDLQLGNPHASVQILVACNPYCGPCAKAEKVLYELLQNKNSDLGITIRFDIKAGISGDKSTRAAAYILQYAYQIDENALEKSQKIREMIHSWYAELNYEKFSAKYPLKVKNNVDEWLLDHEKWCRKSNIRYTPTIFINGRNLPKPYTIEDLPLILPGLRLKIAESKKRAHKEPEALI